MRRYQVGGWCDWVIGKGPLYIGKSGHLVSFCRSLTHRLCKTDLLSSLYKYEWSSRNAISSTALMTLSSSPCHLQGQPSLPGKTRKPPWQTQKSVTDKTTRKKIYVTVEVKLPSSYLHTFQKMLNSYLILQLVRLHSKVTKKVIFSTYLSITLSFIMKQLFSRKT